MNVLSRVMISEQRKLGSEHQHPVSAAFLCTNENVFTVPHVSARLGNVLSAITSTVWTVEKFDEQVGLSYLRGMHINDSKTELNSKRDRHENIGMCVFFVL